MSIHSRYTCMCNIWRNIFFCEIDTNNKSPSSISDVLIQGFSGSTCTLCHSATDRYGIQTFQFPFIFYVYRGIQGDHESGDVYFMSISSCSTGGKLIYSCLFSFPITIQRQIIDFTIPLYIAKFSTTTTTTDECLCV